MAVHQIVELDPDLPPGVREDAAGLRLRHEIHVNDLRGFSMPHAHLSDTGGSRGELGHITDLETAVGQVRSHLAPDDVWGEPHSTFCTLVDALQGVVVHHAWEEAEVHAEAHKSCARHVPTSSHRQAEKPCPNVVVCVEECAEDPLVHPDQVNHLRFQQCAKEKLALGHGEGVSVESVLLAQHEVCRLCTIRAASRRILLLDPTFQQRSR
mmetsp:Transcript_33741/g.73844  ORF Transcript_33741/g.73844 Transcript_33741/m.73844 type:complete len:210 (-) Transcript_33741:1345-1974(-)